MVTRQPIYILFVSKSYVWYNSSSLWVFIFIDFYKVKMNASFVFIIK